MLSLSCDLVELVPPDQVLDLPLVETAALFQVYRDLYLNAGI